MESEDGVLENGAPSPGAPFSPAMASGERCKLPSGVWPDPGRKRIWGHKKSQRMHLVDIKFFSFTAQTCLFN